MRQDSRTMKNQKDLAANDSNVVGCFFNLYTIIRLYVFYFLLQQIGESLLRCKRLEIPSACIIERYIK